MTDQRLIGRRVAVLATDGFEQSDLETPVAALTAAGAEVEVISPKTGAIQGMEHERKRRFDRVDRALKSAGLLRRDDRGVRRGPALRGA